MYILCPICIWQNTLRNTAHNPQTLTVDSVFAQPAVTFFLCHVIVEILTVRPSLLLVRRRGTLYLEICLIRHVTIVTVNFGRFLKSTLYSFY